MRINKIHINNFGKLSNVTYEPGDVFSICEDNGYGKSTIVSFIAAMLYGLPTVRTNAKTFPEREHFMPFSGGNFGGYIELLYQGKNYRIERTFDAKKTANDKLTVYLDGAETSKLGSVPGDTIFGISKENFLRLVTIDSREYTPGMDDDISRKLNNYAQSVGEEFDIQKVIGVIKAKKKECADKRKLASDSIAEAKSRMDDISYMKRRKEGLSNLFVAAKKDCDDAQKAYEDASLNGALVERWKMFDHFSEKADEARERLEAAEKKRDEYLAQNKCQSKKNDALSIVLLILGILLIAAGAGVFLLLKKYKIYCLTCAITGVLLFAAAIIRNANIRKKRNRMEIEAAREIDEEITSLKTVYESAAEDVENFRHENRLSERPDTSFDYEDLRRNFKEKQAEYNRLFAEISKIEDFINEADDTFKSMEENKEKKLEAEENEEFYNTLMEEIIAADAALKAKYVSPIYLSFCRYSKILETVFGDRIVMDKNYNVKYEEGGALRDIRHLSAGNYAILTLCLRLSLVDNMFGDEQPFMILDDPFANLDAENIKKTLALVKEISKEKQIFYFSCHESRKLAI